MYVLAHELQTDEAIPVQVTISEQTVNDNFNYYLLVDSDLNELLKLFHLNNLNETI